MSNLESSQPHGTHGLKGQPALCRSRSRSPAPGNTGGCNHIPYSVLKERLIKCNYRHTENKPLFLAGRHPASDLAKLIDDVYRELGFSTPSQKTASKDIQDEFNDLLKLSLEEFPAKLDQALQRLTDYFDDIFYFGSLRSGNRSKVVVSFDNTSTLDIANTITKRRKSTIFLKKGTHPSSSKGNIVSRCLHETIHAYLDLWCCFSCSDLFEQQGTDGHAFAHQMIAGVIFTETFQYCSGHFPHVGRLHHLAVTIVEMNAPLPSAADFLAWRLDPKHFDMAGLVNQRKAWLREWTQERQAPYMDLLSLQKKQADAFLNEQGDMFKQLMARTRPMIPAGRSTYQDDTQGQQREADMQREQWLAMQQQQQRGRFEVPGGRTSRSPIRGRDSDRTGRRSSVQNGSRNRMTSDVPQRRSRSRSSCGG